MNSLRFKVSFYLVVALTAAVLLFTIMVVRNNREELLQQAISHAAQLSEVVIKSTRFAMLQNQPSHVDKIIQDVGAQTDIDRVRILSKNGTVIHSSQRDEIGKLVDQEAESCLACHLDEKSRSASPMVGRPRFFTDENGRRMLGSTAVIRNEPTCANGGCHAHSADQSVLGVLDIVYPLEQIDATMRKNTITIAGLSLGFVLLAAILVGLLIQRAIYRPLGDLQEGAARLGEGDLEQLIPVRSDDELGQLAASFNSMTRALRKSRVELEEWGHTLEQKVEEATRELHVAQAEAARGEKLASVGLLAAGIAHELNNPLTGVLTFSTLVRKQVPDGSPEAEDLDLVIQETRRCAAIIRRLLDFAPPVGPGGGDRHRFRSRSKPAHGVARRGPDQAGRHEHAGQCPARHRFRGQDHDSHRAVRTEERREGHGGADGPDYHCRHRMRHTRGRLAEDFRSLLHHQGGRQGDRAGIIGQPRYHRGAWGLDRSGQHPGPRH
jgi:two-component system NtrC family sensor kinase